MKALFSRLNRSNRESKQDKEKERDRDTREKERFSTLLPVDKDTPPLPPPSNESPPTLKLEIQSRPLPAIIDAANPSLSISSDAPPPTHTSVESRDQSTRSKQSTVVTSSEATKKVAFISPPPTPAVASRTLSDASSLRSPEPASDSKPYLPKPSTPASRVIEQSRQSSSSSSRSPNPIKATQTSASRLTATPNPSQRTFGLSYHDAASLRSGTPYSHMSSRATLQPAASWSEAAEEDLVSNLGQRERTRQEVLWEIVTSEERYIAELLKLKETFLEPLLHPFSMSLSPTPFDPLLDDHLRAESPQESLENLPIASRFLNSINPHLRPETPGNSSTGHGQGSTRPSTKGDDHPLIDDESDEDDDRMGKGYKSSLSQHRSPYGTAVRQTGKPSSRGNMPFPSRSHQSLPPPARQNLNGSTASLGRQSILANEPPQNSGRKSSAGTTTTQSRLLKKSKKGSPIEEPTIAPHQIPDDLRQCLEVLEDKIIPGHITLCEGLRKRYEEQYPLVRSLADVFVSNSHILHGYATYVLHLERALAQVEDALSTASVIKRPKKQDAAEWILVSKVLQHLEETAADKGETGLAISLSKPFQRLLKYPLLFQNLLFHTDPSTFEYESTLAMVSEVETIVRSIEDEKIQKEERDKTRDIFARIDGLEKVKMLAVPKPSRLLVSERMVDDGHGPPIGTSLQHGPSAAQNGKGVKQKSSLKRLSDVLTPSPIGGKKDLWLVTFNDVVLRCQRTGTTSLPLATNSSTRTNSLPELHSRSKYATTGRRNSHGKPRNMYKFIKIETWAIGDVAKPRAGVISMEDITRTRAQITSTIPRGVDDVAEENEDGNESEESDTKSKMSFSYWGADKVTVQNPARKGVVGTRPVPTKKGVAVTATYVRESSANAKFGTRLRSPEPTDSLNRPASRRHAQTPASRRGGPDEAVKSSAGSKPAWDSNTRVATSTPIKRPQHISSSASTAPRIGKVASPAPSEDSGVGFYRQIISQDPALNRV